MLSKNVRLWLGLIAIISLVSLASSCGKSEEEPPEGGGGTSTAGGAPPPPSKGNEGTISGKITYAGTVPEAKKIDTSADSACTSKNPNLTTEEWVVKDGNMANTFVYIKEGAIDGANKLATYVWPAPGTAATLDQNGCHYKPHVMGVVVKQKISITNSDPTTHNVHFTQGANPDWNQSQPNGAAALSHVLNAAEVMVPVKCNQHPWMKSYIAVLKHPFFAVSAEDGTYTIKGVPPGKYTVVAWHEGGAKGTEKTMEVTVPASGAGKADFAFGGSAMGQPSSLPMMTALEFPMAGKH
jgi:plastocyanin